MRFTQKEYGQPIEILKFNDFKGRHAWYLILGW